MLSFTRHEIRDLGRERIAGAVLSGRRLVTWGDRILVWELPEGRIRAVGARLAGPAGPGGAMLDGDLILNQAAGRRALFRVGLQSGKSSEIDHGVFAHEILPASIHGRSGILLVQRRIQVRFYEAPKDPAKAWTYRELYSFYSPSDQGGLMMVDVDRDGRPDILSGNYWIQCPESFDLHWRLFAIRTWAETRLSGMARMAWSDLLGAGTPNLIVSQSEMRGARLAWFEKPADPKQLWVEHRIEGNLGLDHPGTLLVADFDGGGKPDILAAERAGAGRLMLFTNEGAGRFSPAEMGRTSGVVEAMVVDWNNDGRPDLLVVEASKLSWWENNR
ncbi:MAG TPA: VCBS repeat-containing protein [Bryobacteraceae bacterium]|jgi:VCBS repeat protein|nr:VCBS repeat-containing protein [Bryobacteraceae bacterium]